MNYKTSLKQANAFAMQYGFLFGLLWILGFWFMLNCFNNQYSGFLYFITMVCIPIGGFCFTKRFKKSVYGEFFFPFRISFSFSFLLYLYASILLTIFVFVYFAHLDNGSFLDSYQKYLNQPEVQKIFFSQDFTQIRKELGITKTADISTIISKFREISPGSWALSILDLNLILGFILSIPTALLTSTYKKK